MKFGRVGDISQVDFSFPPEPPANRALLARLPTPTRREPIYVGCTGWSMPEWLGKWYPAGAKTKDFLRHYGQQFTTIELNTTHYRIPDRATVERWREQTPDDFRFCPKLPQSISHERNLGLQDTALGLFWEALAAFGEKLGACFIQLPPFFAADRLPLLSRFLQQWPAEFPLAVEARHESWFASPAEQEALFDLLESSNSAALITDVAGRRDVLHLRLTAPFAMVRFVGNGLHPTDYERIDDWVRLLKKWQDGGLANTYFFTHEPDNILAPEIALYLIERLQENGATAPRPPREFADDRTGEQMSLF